MLDIARSAAALHRRLTDALAEPFLPETDELAQRVDDVECKVWRAFHARVKVLAAED